MILDEPRVASFTRFAQESEPPIRRALTAAFGLDVGREATAEALSYAWEHWGRVRDMDNPAGYVFRVGQRAAKRQKRPATAPALIERPPAEPWVEPQLAKALNRLSAQQRMVVSLLHGFDCSMAEVGRLLGISKATVQVHERRAMKKLRKHLGVSG